MSEESDVRLPSDDTRQQLEALGRRIRMLREPTLTQEEFARRCGISVSFTSLLERGERSPSYETLLRIAKALDVAMPDLFRDRPGIEASDPSHVRLLEFARAAQLSRGQVDRLISVGYAMFGIEPARPGHETTVCRIEGCGRRVLAKGLCGPHYHKHRRARRTAKLG